MVAANPHTPLLSQPHCPTSSSSSSCSSPSCLSSFSCPCQYNATSASTCTTLPKPVPPATATPRRLRETKSNAAEEDRAAADAYVKRRRWGDAVIRLVGWHWCEKLWYFLFFGSQFTQMFMPLILAQLMNFDPATIGVLMSARRGAIAAGAPLLTLLADATRTHRALLAVALSAYYCCTLVLARVRAVSAVTLTLLLRDALLAGVEPIVNAAVLASLVVRNARDFSRPCAVDVEAPPLQPPESEEQRLDSRARAREGEGAQSRGEGERRGEDKGGGFGAVRAWGSFGWGVLSFVVPAVCSLAFGTGDAAYVPMLVSQVLVGIFVVLLTVFGLDLSSHLFSQHDPQPDASPPTLPSQPDHSAPSSSSPLTSSSPSVNQGLRSLWNETDHNDAISCLLASLLQGAVLGAVQTTLFLYLSTQNIPTSLLGLSVAASCLGETILFSQEHNLRRTHSDRLALRAAIAGNALTLCLYASISPCPSGLPSLVALLLAEAVNGASYALFLAAAVALAARAAPKHRRAAAQGVVQCVAFGIGPAIGALLGGKLYQSIGPLPLYLLFAFLDVLLVLLIPS